MHNSPIGPVSPLPYTSSRNTSYLFKIQVPTELALYDFTAQKCVLWSVERPWFFPLGEALHRLHIFINCSYLRVLIGHYGPEYTTHLINVAKIAPKVWKISSISITLTYCYDNYWHVNPMTINDIHNLCLGFVDHNMTVGITLGPWV